jgi:hypothetical protein
MLYIKPLSYIPVNNAEVSGTFQAYSHDPELGLENATRRPVKDSEKYISDTFLQLEIYSLIKVFSCGTNFMKRI